MGTVTWSQTTDTLQANFSDGGLTHIGIGAGGMSHARGNLDSYKFGGKWYFEVLFSQVIAGHYNELYIGVGRHRSGFTPGSNYEYVWRGDGYTLHDAVTTAHGTAVTSGSPVLMCAYSMDKIWFGANGSWFGSGDPANDANPAFSGLFLHGYKPYGGYYVANNTSRMTGRFAEADWQYAAPSGFHSLNEDTFTHPHYLVTLPHFDDEDHDPDGGGIAGVVTEVGVPGAYRVCLHRQSDGKLLRQMWSNAQGVYAFENLKDQRYFLLVIDHTNPLRSPAIQDNVIPS